MNPAREEPLTLPMPFNEAVERFLRINPRATEEPQPITGKATPFVKWVGGKRSIIGELIQRLPAEFNCYWEPFVGGGALFFGIIDRITSARLSDSNLDLVITYNAIKRDPIGLLAKLEEHGRKHNDTYYYKVRDQQSLQDSVAIAARFIYLNKTCFNGLYRVNKKGEFNVPIGSYVNPDVVQRENIKLCSTALQKAQIQYHEFDAIRPENGDFVYFDPPYHPVANGSFTKYTKSDFNEVDQARLRDFAVGLTRQGVRVMLSNSDTPLIRDLFSNPMWHISTVEAPRMVNCKADGRGNVNELIITNYVT